MCRGFVLGGGVTGLSAGAASGLPVFEAEEVPGGICSSYYVRPGETTRLHVSPRDGEAYRFEMGGGHWIFGGDPAVLQYLRQTAPMGTYARRSGVWFADEKLYVPYPLQNHLRYLGADLAAKALEEMSNLTDRRAATMEEWLQGSFGQTLCEKFFVPFHELYTAGLYKSIAPQDAYKSPGGLGLAIRGAFSSAPAVGYNIKFLYPQEGLDALTRRMAERCTIKYGCEVVAIDVRAKAVHFKDGSELGYENLLCTLPLNKTLQMAGLSVDEPNAPYTSVLVLNIGGIRGSECPDDHWLYHPRTRAGFHRVGFYSNVDRSFLPRSSQERGDRVSIYVEKAFPGGCRPEEAEIQRYGQAVVEELRAWGFIESAEVVDPTWIDVAYTWSYPNSNWKQKALRLLEDHGIFMIGRYGRWTFQGIADSIRDGFYAGASFRNS